MKTLYEIAGNPSGLDSYSNYMGERPDKQWLCLLTHNRDSECLSESNWRVALKMLGGESESVEIFRFGHWACGWWEALCVKEGSPQQSIAEDIEAGLADYPVLSDEDYTELEMEEADKVWSNCYDNADRLEYIRKNRSQFEFQNMADLMGCVKGKYFAGYASELLE